METRANKHPIEDMNDLEFLTKLISFFGSQRAAELLGWAFVAGVVSWDNPTELRRKMEGRGMTKSGMYRALADFRRFGEHVEDTTVPLRDTSFAIKYMRKFSDMRLAFP